MRIGSLFSGYGGLDMAVQSVLGGEVAWVSDIEPASCQVLAAHHPGVPNLGDITVIDWATVPPIDVLTGGYPCQPFSHAGQRKGTDDRRHLWPHVLRAIVALRPMVCIFENVDGHRSLGLDVVLGDIASIGMSARWLVVRAADAGAPHGRKRIFIVVTPDSDGRGHGQQQDARGMDDLDRRDEGPSRERARALANTGGVATATDADSAGRWVRSMQGLGGGYEARADVFGVFWPAVERWERIIGRVAPDPVVSGALNPQFVEFMMGLPAGHVTGHGLRPAQELKMLGNGVVPQQAALALRMLGVGGDAVAVGNDGDLLSTPVASVSQPAPWKPGVDWWLQSRAARNLEAIVTGNTPHMDSP